MKAKHKPKEDGRLNGKVATNNIIIESLPYLSYGSDADIIPYGIDNMYPERMLKALRKSPTARGCASLFERFVFGQGFAGGDEIIVNRMGETLNAVLSKSVKNYSEMFGMAIHLNFNWMGQIIEMFSVDMDFPRKHKTLDKADLGFWVNGGSNWTNNKVTLDLYGFRNPVTEMKKKGYWQYNGQLFYFSKGDTIYPRLTARLGIGKCFV